MANPILSAMGSTGLGRLWALVRPFAGEVTVQDVAEKGAANGYASLDAGGKVPSAQIPAIPESGVTDLVADLAAKEATANKGAASGYAPLDSLSKVPTIYLPSWVRSVAIEGDAQLTGEVTLSAGSNVTLTRTGNDIEIAASAGGISGLKVDKAGALIGTRPEVNLIAGANVTLTVADNPSSDRVDVTIDAAAGGISGVKVDKAGALIGTRPEVNLIEGANVTLTVADNGASNRVDVTVAAAAPGISGLIVDKAGVLVGTRPEVNLIAGSGVTLTVADNAGSNRVDVTIAASGGGGVTSLAKSGAAALTGAVTLSEGSGITLTESGNDIAIAAAVAWAKVVNESGASFANWTAVNGSWASDGTSININGGTGTTLQAAKLTAAQRQEPACVYEADIYFDSSSSSTTNQIAGLLARYDGVNSSTPGCIAVRLRCSSNTPNSNGQIDIEQAGTANWKTFAKNFTADAWHTLRIVFSANSVDVYLDGTYIGGGSGVLSAKDASFIGLYVLNGKWRFKNIHLYTLPLP